MSVYSELLQRLVRSQKEDWAYRIAGLQYGPREPVRDELLSLAAWNSMFILSPATRESLELMLNSRDQTDKGLLALAYVFRLEHTFTYAEDSTFFGSHSFLFKAIEDITEFGVEESLLFRDWLKECATRQPSHATHFEEQHLKSFYLLGVLSIDAHLLSMSCAECARVIRDEIASYDKEVTPHGGSPASSVLDIDGYMSRDSEWRQFWRQKATALNDAMLSISRIVSDTDT